MISNVGDSRAVMGTRDKDDHLTAIQLTVDLKPNLPGILAPSFYVRLSQALANVIHYDSYEAYRQTVLVP